MNFMQKSKTTFDLIVSCDVFVYLGDLNITFEHVSKSLSPNGVFAFSTEQQIGCGKDEECCKLPYILDTTKRFKHCSKYNEPIEDPRIFPHSLFKWPCYSNARKIKC